MKIKSLIHLTLAAAIAGGAGGAFVSCSEERHPYYEATPEITDVYIDKLEEAVNNLKNELSQAEFGEKKGMYPSESRAILTDAIDNANRYVLLIKYAKPSPSESEKQRYLDECDNAMSRFRATVRTENVKATPADLFVDGRGSGAESYIDFGHDEEYFNFGAAGLQSFTVEFWVKVTKAGGKDQNVFLSTLVNQDGWSMYWRNADGGIYRGTWGDEQGLVEPSFKAPADGEWVYFAMTYSDTGLPDAPALRARHYVNGETKTTEGGVGQRQYKFNVFAAHNKPMTAFGRYMRNGDDMLFEEGFAGYMKKIRIWKEAKDVDYLNASYNGEVTVTGSEPMLVAAWDFTTKPDGVDNVITDLTGRHTATIHGNYKWERIINND